MFWEKKVLKLLSIFTMFKALYIDYKVKLKKYLLAFMNKAAHIFQYILTNYMMSIGIKLFTVCNLS